MEITQCVFIKNVSSMRHVVMVVLVLITTTDNSGYYCGYYAAVKVYRVCITPF